MPSPQPLCEDAASIVASRTDALLVYKDEIVTSSPQKLFRYLVDAVSEAGFKVLVSREPTISPLSIGEVGDVKGYLMAESQPREVYSPYSQYRAIGYTLIAVSILLLVAGIALIIQGSIAGGILSFIIFIILLVVGITLKDKHLFESLILQLWIRGEVYRTRAARESAIDTSLRSSVIRSGLVSELRLTIAVTKIYTKNSGLCRTVVDVEASHDVKNLFEILVENIKTKILPRIEVPLTTDEVKARAMREIGIEERIGTIVDIEEKLERLKRLYDRGLISKDEYESLRKKLLEEHLLGSSS